MAEFEKFIKKVAEIYIFLKDKNDTFIRNSERPKNLFK